MRDNINKKDPPIKKKTTKHSLSPWHVKLNIIAIHDYK